MANGKDNQFQRQLRYGKSQKNMVKCCRMKKGWYNNFQLHILHTVGWQCNLHRAFYMVFYICNAMEFTLAVKNKYKKPKQ